MLIFILSPLSDNLLCLFKENHLMEDFLFISRVYLNKVIYELQFIMEDQKQDFH